MENLLMVARVPKLCAVFIKVVSFNHEERDERWSLLMDYLLYSLSTLGESVKVSFILMDIAADIRSLS
jgi:hypothetical protein